MFSIFLLESSYGISHIEDLSPLELIKALDKINSLSFTQKVDGVNLAFGIDVNGKFYTSREHKGGTRFYTSTEYPNEPKYDYFKTAHMALQKVNTKLRDIVDPGTKVSIEVIMNNQTNVMSYKENQIVFLEPLPGDDPSIEPDFSVINKLASKLKNVTVEVQSKLSTSENGTSILELPISTKWIFHRSSKVDSKSIITDEVKAKIKSIQSFLKSTKNDNTVLDILLSKDKEQKELKNSLSDELRNMVIELKNMLLTDSLKTKLKNKETPDGYFDSIEGLVATDLKTGNKIKIVDRREFTEVNKFYYRYRNLIKSPVLTTDEQAELDVRGGILGVAKTRCIKLFNIPGLELASSKKHALSMFGDKNEFTQNIHSALAMLNVTALKKKMISVYENAETELAELLKDFTSSVDSTLKIKVGNNELKYTPEIKERTLLAFATAKQELAKMKRKVSHAKSINDLFMIYFKDDVNGSF